MRVSARSGYQCWPTPASSASTRSVRSRCTGSCSESRSWIRRRGRKFPSSQEPRRCAPGRGRQRCGYRGSAPQGTGPALTAYLPRVPPAQFIYVSCGLESFLRDVRQLTGEGAHRLSGSERSISCRLRTTSKRLPVSSAADLLAAVVGTGADRVTARQSGCSQCVSRRDHSLRQGLRAPLSCLKTYLHVRSPSMRTPLPTVASNCALML